MLSLRNGGTLAGISAGLGGHQRAIGFSVLKGGDFLVGKVADLQRDALGYVRDNWTIECGFSCGGFARRTPELDSFIKSFQQARGLTLDWVYVARMMFGVHTLVERGRFQRGTSIVAVVTG